MWKKKKRSKKGGKMRNSLVGLENGYPSAYEVGTCYEVMFFFLDLFKKFTCALMCAISQIQGLILGEQIRNFNF